MTAGWVLERAARVLNGQLAESVSAARVASELEGRSCRISVEGVPLDFVIRIEDGRVRLSGPVGGEDVSIIGPPLDLLRLFRGDAVGPVRDTRARVSGEVRTAEKFAELLKLSAPDLEEELSAWVGDLAAHRLAETARRGKAWALSAAAAMRDNAAEYLKEEGRLVAGPHEADEFYASVDRLRDDVERAAARVEKLVAALGSR